MSKAYLKDLLRDRSSGNFFFSTIKQEWVKTSLEKSKDYTWSKNVNPSSTFMTWDGCIWEGMRKQAAEREAKEADTIQYLEVGNFFHEGFMKWAQKIDGMLWEKPVFPTKEENEKLEKAWPEVPFYWSKFCVSGRADIILNVKGHPCVGDLKIPQRDKDSWVKYKSTLPEDTHMCQAAIGALALEEMGILESKYIAVLYFNPRITPKGDDGYKECYRDFTPQLKSDTLYLVEHSYEERCRIVEGIDVGCTYPKCKKHGSKR